jgi:phosphoserine phosphatase
VSAGTILLVHVTGQDKPGLTLEFTTTLGRHGARILDVGQAVIHDALALGFLIELPSGGDAATLMGDLRADGGRLGVHVAFSKRSLDEYGRWVCAQAKQRFIVTVLAPSIPATDLASVAGALTSAGLNIDRIDRLSARLPLSRDSMVPSRVCVEFSASAPDAGRVIDEAAVRSSLARLAEPGTLDVAFQHDSVFRRSRRLVAFDMDSTLIQGEVIDELARLAGTGAQVRAITEAAMRGDLDFETSFRRRVQLLRGLSATTLTRVIDTIPLTDGAERLVEVLRRLGYRTAILSGGFSFFGRALQARLGIDDLFANTLDVQDGVVTGRVVSPIVDGARKAALLRQLARDSGLSLEQCIAIGDGANDLPMLQIAGLGVAFHAKPLVRQGARQSISSVGLDGILYLLGVRDRETVVVPSAGALPT